MRTWQKAVLFLMAVLALAVMDAQAQLPVYLSVTPEVALTNTPTDLVLKGKNFRSGMVMQISGPFGSIPQQTKVVNQTTAYVHVDGSILTTTGRKRFWLLTKDSRIDSGVQYFWVCDPFEIGLWEQLPTDANGDLHYRLVQRNGCSY